jgi:hypothetical protein
MAQPLRVPASLLSILEIQFWAILCALELMFTLKYEMTLLQIWQGRLYIYKYHVNINPGSIRKVEPLLATKTKQCPAWYIQPLD